VSFFGLQSVLSPSPPSDDVQWCPKKFGNSVTRQVGVWHFESLRRKKTIMADHPAKNRRGLPCVGGVLEPR